MRYRTSPHRQAILRVVKFSRLPLSSAEVRRRVSRIPAGSVYRHLRHLVAHGEIFHMAGRDGEMRYIGQPWHDAVFTCMRCKKVRHMSSSTLPGYADRKLFGRQRVITTQLIAQGLCAGCARENQS